MFSVFKDYKTPTDDKLFQNISKDGIYIKPNIIEFARGNNKTALYQIGEAYSNLHTRIAYLKALDWYQKSANAGSAIAQNRIGEMYHHGHGVPKDYRLALKWYMVSAQTGGSSAAHNNLGMMYYDGKGVDADHAKALTCFSVAANQGYRDAQYNLAWMYDSERSPVHDKLEAIKWYTMASEQGHPEATKRIIQLNKLGIRYHPELGATQQRRSKTNSSANKSTSGARTDYLNKNSGQVNNNEAATRSVNDVSLSTDQVQSMIDTNREHADMVQAKREKQLEDEKILHEVEEARKKEQQKEFALQQERIKIENELKLQREKEIQLESKNREQERAMQELRERMERERIEREEEKKREQEQVQNKLNALEKMIAEMKTQTTLDLPQQIPQKPDEKEKGDTKAQLPELISNNNSTHDRIYTLGRVNKRQSKQLRSKTSKDLLEKEAAIPKEEKVIVEGEKIAIETEKEEQEYTDDEDDDYENDLCLDDTSSEDEIVDDDIYYDSQSEEE